jgi:hypothetical protein
MWKAQPGKGPMLDQHSRVWLWACEHRFYLLTGSPRLSVLICKVDVDAHMGRASHRPSMWCSHDALGCYFPATSEPYHQHMFFLYVHWCRFFKKTKTACKYFRNGVSVLVKALQDTELMRCVCVCVISHVILTESCDHYVYYHNQYMIIEERMSKICNVGRQVETWGIWCCSSNWTANKLEIQDSWLFRWVLKTIF